MERGRGGGGHSFSRRPHGGGAARVLARALRTSTRGRGLAIQFAVGRYLRGPFPWGASLRAELSIGFHPQTTEDHTTRTRPRFRSGGRFAVPGVAGSELAGARDF